MQLMTNNPSKNPSKILVVDDNLLNRKLACAILNGCNIDNDIAENGRIAYEKYLTGEFKLILMDIQMPIMNGIDSAKMIRKHEAETGKIGSIPIVAVTTFTMSSDKKNCFEAGMNEVLGKPYRTDDLIDMISRFTTIEKQPTS